MSPLEHPPPQHGILDDVPGEPSLSYFWRRKRDRSLQLLQRHCEFAAPASAPRRMVLADLGCGWGTDLYFFLRALRDFNATGAPAHDWHIIGIDGAGYKLAMAKDRIKDLGIDVELMRDDFIPHVALPDQSVDLIYCSEVLEHLEDPTPFIAEWRRILRPGGLVLVTTPNEPNVLQRSFYSRARREANRSALMDGRETVTNDDGKPFAVFGHIGIRRIDEWEALFATERFTLVGFERGALVYGSPWTNRAGIFRSQLIVEHLLDLLPKRLTRFLSDELIGLYRRG